MSIDDLRTQRAAAYARYQSAVERLNSMTSATAESFWRAVNRAIDSGGEPDAVAAVARANQRLQAQLDEEDAARAKRIAASEEMARIDRQIAALA